MAASRPSPDEFFMGMLDQWASRSTCPRRQVAAILVDERGRILSAGYNGVPSGLPHCRDGVTCPGAQDATGDTSRCIAVHAEQNAIVQCHRLDLAHTLYIHCTPCFSCAKLICNTNVQRIVAFEIYPDENGLRLLRHKGVEVETIERKSAVLPTTDLEVYDFATVKSLREEFNHFKRLLYAAAADNKPLQISERTYIAVGPDWKMQRSVDNASRQWYITAGPETRHGKGS